MKTGQQNNNLRQIALSIRFFFVLFALINSSSRKLLGLYFYIMVLKSHLALACVGILIASCPVNSLGEEDDDPDPDLQLLGELSSGGSR